MERSWAPESERERALKSESERKRVAKGGRQRLSLTNNFLGGMAAVESAAKRQDERHKRGTRPQSDVTKGAAAGKNAAGNGELRRGDTLFGGSATPKPTV